jgi:hypothetical protein
VVNIGNKSVNEHHSPEYGHRSGVCGWREGEDDLYLSYISENDLHSSEYGHCSRGDEE